MATNTPARVRITDVAPLNDDGRESLRNGLSDAASAFGSPEIDRLYDEMPCRFTEPVCVAAWEKIQAAAVEDVIDQVGALLIEAMQRRLPFEWEGPEMYR